MIPQKPQLKGKFLRHAISYAQHGLHVFPLLPESKVPYASSNGVNDATDKLQQILQWWKQTPEANIAIATGAKSGFFVIDVDPRHGGDKSLAELEAKHGPLPATVSARTGGGGSHYLFKYPGWRVCNNNTGKVGAGIDVKGDGGYIVAPPSIHDTTKKAYRWSSTPVWTAIADAPAWLLARVTDPRGTEKAEAISVFSIISVPSVEDAIRLTLPDGPGQRYHRLFTYARALKAIPEYRDADLPTLKPLVRRWFEAALPKIQTRDFDETWSDFVAGWPNVKYPLGVGPMDEALKRARAADLPKCAQQYDSDEMRLLVKLCRELQLLAGEGPFYLSARLAGDAIGLPRTNAHRFLKVLLADNVLQLVERHTQRKATRYRFVGDAVVV